MGHASQSSSCLSIQLLAMHAADMPGGSGSPLEADEEDAGDDDGYEYDFWD